MHPLQHGLTVIPVTPTIKQVPEHLAEGLHQRAAANRQRREIVAFLDGDPPRPIDAALDKLPGKAGEDARAPNPAQI